MSQKTTNNGITVRINRKRGFNRPHRFHVIESLSGGLVIYNAPIGLDLTGNFSKGSLSVHDPTCSRRIAQFFAKAFSGLAWDFQEQY